MPIVTPILPNAFITWQKEYRRTEIAAKEASMVLNNINNGMSVVIPYIGIDMFNISLMLNDIVNILFNRLVIFNNYLYISYKFGNYEVKLGTSIINVDEHYLYNALTTIFYKYPRINFNYIIPRQPIYDNIRL